MTKLVETRTPVSPCPSCGAKNNAASGTGTPGPGDVSICLYCGHISLFADDLTLRPATDEELVEVKKHPEMLLAIEMVEQHRKLHEIFERLTAPDEHDPISLDAISSPKGRRG